MTSFVIDASVALKWFLPEPDSDKADELIRADVDLIAPGLISIELANAVWKHSRIGSADAAIWEDVAARMPDLLTIHSSDGPLLQAAIRLAVAYDHPFYDCLYLALAIHLGAVVVTIDKRFLSAFAKTEYAGRVIPLEAAAQHT